MSVKRNTLVHTHSARDLLARASIADHGALLVVIPILSQGYLYCMRCYFYSSIIENKNVQNTLAFKNINRSYLRFSIFSCGLRFGICIQMIASLYNIMRLPSFLKLVLKLCCYYFACWKSKKSWSCLPHMKEQIGNKKSDFYRKLNEMCPIDFVCNIPTNIYQPLPSTL